MDLQLKGKKALVTGSTAESGFPRPKRWPEKVRKPLSMEEPCKAWSMRSEKIREEIPDAKLHGAAFDLSGAKGCQGLVENTPKWIFS